MNFGPDGPHGARRTTLHLLDDVFGAAAVVGRLHDVPRHFGVNDDADAGMLTAQGVNLRGGESNVDRAVALPQDHPCALQVVRIDAAEDLIGVPHDHLVERDAHLVGGVAPEMLIGKEENLLAALERPLQRCPGV